MQGVLGASIAGQQKEYLQMYYLVLQVCYYLMVGQVKCVKSEQLTPRHRPNAFSPVVTK